jgi:hypothetical protein
MLIKTSASFVKEFIDSLDEALQELQPNAKLTATQKTWLGFCLMGILMLNAVNWAKFERAGLGSYKSSALSWMLHHAKIKWELLLRASVITVLKQHGITEGTLVLDESDRARSKRTRFIYKAHKQKDKATGGYVNGQTIVLLLLVTKTVTFPVGFTFYSPDPVVSAWRKEDNRLKKEGIAKKNRPVKPAKNSDYPSKLEIALDLLQSFKNHHPEININSILADALYGTADFMDKASMIFDGIQVVSQLRSSQNIKLKGKLINLEHYFNKTNQGVSKEFSIRGGKRMEGTVSSSRLYVDAHGKKRFIIALKYEGEKKYRYLVATDMTWRTIDIIQAYTLRWLVEVFFEDWKLYEGWGQEAKQLGEDGSSRSLILSLLFDHCLLLHPEQKACVENKQPMNTVGSLLRRLQMEALLEIIADLLSSADDIGGKLKELANKIKTVFQLMPSGKHMIGRDLGRLESTNSLSCRANG